MIVKYDRENLMMMLKSISQSYQDWWDKCDNLKIDKKIQDLKQYRKKYILFGKLISDVDGLTDDEIRELAIKKLNDDVHEYIFTTWREYGGADWKDLADNLYNALNLSSSKEAELSTEDELYLISLYKAK